MKEIHLQAGGDTEICESKDHLEFIYLDHIKSVSDFGEKFKCHLQNTNFIRIASYTVIVTVIDRDRKFHYKCLPPLGLNNSMYSSVSPFVLWKIHQHI